MPVNADTTTDDGVPERVLMRMWLGLMAVSAVLFGATVLQHQLVVGTVLVVASGFAGMLAVFAVIRLVAEHHRDLRASRRLVFVCIAGAVIGLGLVQWGLSAEIQAVTALGTMLLIHAGAFLSDAFNQAVAPSEGAAKSGTSAVVALLVMAVATLLLSLQSEFTAVAGVGFAVWLFALVVLKLTVVQFAIGGEVRREFRANLAWTLAVLALPVGGAALAVGGVFGLVWAASLLVGGLSVLGLLVHNGVPLPAPVRRWTGLESLMPMAESEAETRSTFAISRSWIAFMVGAAAAAICLWRLTVLSETLVAAIGIAVVLILLGAFFVLPGEAVFGAIVLSFLVVWVAEDTDAARPEIDNADIAAVEGSSDAWIVALGDSFISGEGASDFYAGTNSPGSNECRRAPTAYPPVVGKALGMQVMSFACSGATTRHVLEEGQQPDSPREIAGGEAQLDALTEWLDDPAQPRVELVLLSIGGNDSGFSDVITSCLTPGANCAEAESAFIDRVGELAPELKKTYSKVVDVFARRDTEPPRILVTPYPDPIGGGRALDQDCGLTLSTTETAFIRRFRSALNSQIETAIEGEPNIELVPSHRALVGHELCEPDAFVNWLRLSPPDGAFFRAINPSTWKNGSLHPIAGGHCVTALFVLDAVAPGDETVPRPDECELPPPATAPPTGTSSMPATVDQCGADYADIEDQADTTDGEDNSMEPQKSKSQKSRAHLCTELWLSGALESASRNLIMALALSIVAGLALAGGISTFDQPTKLPPLIDRAWTLLRKAWLDYDRVAHGPRANPEDHLRSNKSLL